MSAEYNIVKLFLSQGHSVESIHKKLPQISKSTIYRYLKIYNLEKYKENANNLVYHTAEWRDLKNKVAARDGRKCLICGSVKNLQLDHIIPKSLRPDLASDLTNLRLLCYKCHKNTDTYGKSGIKNYVKKAKLLKKKLSNS